MAIHDFKSQRVCVAASLAPDVEIVCSDEQANYLANVLRMKQGDLLLIFNGRDGEWRAEIAGVRKRRMTIRALEQVRVQTDGTDLEYFFAPLKHARLDYMVQKATELGVSRLAPVMTKFTIAERVNIDRMRANVVEAAEQCGVLRLPEVAQPVKLSSVLAAWVPARRLIFCDEDAPVADPVATLAKLGPGPVAVLIGPEGGFCSEERALIRAVPQHVSLSLGPRIMRADTAAVAALTLVNATIGDWQ